MSRSFGGFARQCLQIWETDLRGGKIYIYIIKKSEHLLLPSNFVASYAKLTRLPDMKMQLDSNAVILSAADERSAAVHLDPGFPASLYQSPNEGKQIPAQWVPCGTWQSHRASLLLLVCHFQVSKSCRCIFFISFKRNSRAYALIPCLIYLPPHSVRPSRQNLRMYPLFPMGIQSFILKSLHKGR